MALAGAAWPLASLTGCASVGGKRPQVVVVGAGWGGEALGKNLHFMLRHYKPSPMTGPQREFH